MIGRRPRVADWVTRLCARPSHASGIGQWFNPGYLEIFERERDGARARANEIPTRSG